MMTDKTSVLVLSMSSLQRDPRVLRQITFLREKFEVHTAGYGPAPSGVSSHTEIPETLKNWRTDYRRFYALVLARRFHRVYFGAPWVRFLRDRIVSGRFDIVLANDVNAVPVALALKPRMGVHADLHEYATRQDESDGKWKKYIRPIFEWILRRHLPQVESVTTITTMLASEYAKEYGLTCDVVSNAPPERTDISVRPTAENMRIVHTGAAARSRQLEDMIEAVAIANATRQHQLDFDLYLMAGDAAYIRELNALAQERGAGRIHVRDPLPFSEMIDGIAGYDVGLYGAPPMNFNQRAGMPNKLFEFVQARIGSVIGPQEVMAEFVHEYGFGAVAEGFSAEALAAVLISLTPQEVDHWKHAADAAAPLLNSEHLSGAWVSALDAIVEKHTQ